MRGVTVYSSYRHGNWGSQTPILGKQRCALRLAPCSVAALTAANAYWLPWRAPTNTSSSAVATAPRTHCTYQQVHSSRARQVPLFWSLALAQPCNWWSEAPPLSVVLCSLKPAEESLFLFDFWAALLCFALLCCAVPPAHPYPCKPPANKPALQLFPVSSPPLLSKKRPLGLLHATALRSTEPRRRQPNPPTPNHP